MIADDVAHVGIGIGIEVANRQRRAEPLPAFSVEEEDPVGGQKAADVLSDLAVPDPVLNAPRLQEAAQAELGKDLQRFADSGVPVGGEVPPRPPEILHEGVRQQELVQIDGADEVGAAVSDVARLDRGVRPELILQPDVPLLHGRRPQVGIEREQGGRGIGQDSVARGPRNLELGRLDRDQPAAADRAADPRQHDGLVQSVIGAERIRDRRHVVVEHVVPRESRAQDQLIGQLAGHADVRGEVVPVAVEEGPSGRRSGEVDDGVRVEHRLGAAHRQQCQALRLVGDGVQLPPEAEGQAGFRGDPPGVSHMEVQEVLAENASLRRSVHEPRGRRDDVEGSIGFVDDAAERRQQPGGPAQLVGRDPAGEQPGHEWIRDSGAEAERVGRHESRVVVGVDLRPPNAPAQLDGVRSRDPGQAVAELQVAGLASLVHEVPDGIGEPAEAQTIAVGEGLVVGEPGPVALDAEARLVHGVPPDRAGQAERRERTPRALARPRPTREDGVDVVEHGVRRVQAEMMQRPHQRMPRVHHVVSPEHQPPGVGVVGAVEPVSGRVPSVAHAGVVGPRRRLDQRLNDRIGGDARRVEQVHRGHLAVVLPDVAEISPARRIRQDAPHDGRRTGLPLLFVVEEEERPVPCDGAAHVESELVDPHPLLFYAGGLVEEVRGVERLVPVI